MSSSRGGLAALADAERSFSQTAGEIGIKDSFLAYFAEDSIDFEPDPGPAIARIQSGPHRNTTCCCRGAPCSSISRATATWATPPAHTRARSGRGSAPRSPRLLLLGMAQTEERRVEGCARRRHRRARHGDAAAQAAGRDRGRLRQGQGQGSAGATRRDTRIGTRAGCGLAPCRRGNTPAPRRRVSDPRPQRRARDLGQPRGTDAFRAGRSRGRQSPWISPTAMAASPAAKATGGSTAYYAHVWKRAPSGKWAIVAQIEQAAE